MTRARLRVRLVKSRNKRKFVIWINCVYQLQTICDDRFGLARMAALRRIRRRYRMSSLRVT